MKTHWKLDNIRKCTERHSHVKKFISQLFSPSIVSKYGYNLFSKVKIVAVFMGVGVGWKK